MPNTHQLSQFSDNTSIVKQQFNYCESPTEQAPDTCHNKLISELLKQHRLTDCFEWLERNAGIAGESAIFTLSCLGGEI